jgi:hypothetical protein
LRMKKGRFLFCPEMRLSFSAIADVKGLPLA